MKNVLIALITLFLLGCNTSGDDLLDIPGVDNRPGGNNATTLTIQNESGHTVTNVMWNNVDFGTISPGRSETRLVTAGSGFVRMRPSNNPYNLRTEAQLHVTAGQQQQLVLNNNMRILRELDNTGHTLHNIANTHFNTQIGGTGPGGGTIFFAQGGTFREVSGELGTFTTSWDSGSQAVRAASNLRAGGFDDWQLPNSGDMQLLYDNLHRRGLGDFASSTISTDRYWSSSFTGSSFNFQTGGWVNTSMNSLQRVRAVREFSVN
ncbi:MAG: DUF1566 domain-containing protein [Spirochaetaceae bacterium]|nr:DUF1566 domain-containing protein [Spirochaetaceae bacterium]